MPAWGSVVVTDVVGVDPFGVVAAGERHEVYASLARTGPIHRIQLPSGPSAWLVIGYRQVRELLNDPYLVKAPHQGR